MTKKYYWLKLNENFFDREEIKVIESMPNGVKYINFYLKLLLKSIQSQGKLLFRGVIPYTADMLASITNTDVDTVVRAINIFIELGLIEKLDDGALFLLETQNMIGHETEWAKKKREYREKKLPEEDEIKKIEGQCPLSVHAESDKRLEIEKEIDIDIEIDIEKEIETIKSLSSVWTSNGFGTLNKNMLDILLADVEIYSLEWVIESIGIGNKSGKRSYSYIKGILNNWQTEGKGGKKDGGSRKSNRAESAEGIGFEI